MAGATRAGGRDRQRVYTPVDAILACTVTTPGSLTRKILFRTKKTPAAGTTFRFSLVPDLIERRTCVKS